MSEIDQLIWKLCPEGVQFSPIGEIAKCVSGATPSSSVGKYWENGTIPWMSSGEVNKRIIENTDTCITQEGFDSCSTKMIPRNSVVIALAGQGKTRGLVALTKIDLCTNQSLCAVIPGSRVKSAFLYHYLKGQYQNLRAASSGDGGRGGLNLQIVRDYLIPVPPIEIQDEVVRILDLFTELEVELEAELEARKKQYEFYRNQLLSFTDVEDEGVRWLKLEEVAKIKNGSDHKHLQDGPYPLYGSGGVMRTVEKFSYNKPSVLIPRKGSLKNLFYLDKPFWTVDTIFYTEINDSLVHPKFLFHWLKVQELEKLDVAGGVPSLTQTILNRVMIPLPDISTQIEISDKLDAFSTLLESAKTGLPAEIAARRQQYEYYRNKLLTFKELEAS